MLGEMRSFPYPPLDIGIRPRGAIGTAMGRVERGVEHPEHTWYGRPGELADARPSMGSPGATALRYQHREIDIDVDE